MPKWVTLKPMSLWAWSETQVEVCAMARGAASARMPDTSANLFIDSFPFGAGLLSHCVLNP
jgi:hypothetical protein